nr:protein IWS1 homolog isoform X1 [Ipomoea batatas]
MGAEEGMEINPKTFVEEEDDDDEGPPPGFDSIAIRLRNQGLSDVEIGKEQNETKYEEDRPPLGWQSTSPKQPHQSMMSSELVSDTQMRSIEEDDDGPPPGWQWNPQQQPLPESIPPPGLQSAPSSNIQMGITQEDDDGPPPGWQLISSQQKPPQTTPPLLPQSVAPSGRHCLVVWYGREDVVSKRLVNWYVVLADSCFHILEVLNGYNARPARQLILPLKDKSNAGDAQYCLCTHMEHHLSNVRLVTLSRELGRTTGDLIWLHNRLGDSALPIKHTRVLIPFCSRAGEFHTKWFLCIAPCS